MCASMVDIQSTTAEIRQGEKRRRRNKPQGKNIMSASATQGGHKNGYNFTCMRHINAEFGFEIRFQLSADSSVTLP